MKWEISYLQSISNFEHDIDRLVTRVARMKHASDLALHLVSRTAHAELDDQKVALRALARTPCCSSRCGLGSDEHEHEV